jgi:hypothetical protein
VNPKKFISILILTSIGTINYCSSVHVNFAKRELSVYGKISATYMTNNFLVIGSEKGVIQVFDTAILNEMGSLQYSEPIKHVRISKDGTKVMFATETKLVFLEQKNSWLGFCSKYVLVEEKEVPLGITVNLDLMDVDNQTYQTQSRDEKLLEMPSDQTTAFGFGLCVRKSSQFTNALSMDFLARIHNLKIYSEKESDPFLEIDLRILLQDQGFCKLLFAKIISEQEIVLFMQINGVTQFIHIFFIRNQEDSTSEHVKINYESIPKWTAGFGSVTGQRGGCCLQ